MKGFLALEILLLLLAMVSVYPYFSSMVKKEGVDLTKESSVVVRSKLALASLALLIERTPLEGTAEANIPFPVGKLKVSGNTLELNVGGTLLHTKVPLKLEDNVFDVNGIEEVRTEMADGKVKVVIS